MSSVTELFVPDHFSQPGPRYRLASEQEHLDVTRLFNEWFQYLGRIKKIEAIRAEEINSRNFRVDFGDRAVLAKSLTHSPEETERLGAISAWLARDGTQVAMMLRNDSGTFSTTHGDRNWLVSEFQPGAYFRGEPAEVEPVFAAIRRLDEALYRCPVELWPPGNVTADIDAMRDLVREVRRRDTDWPSLFDPELVRVLPEVLPVAERTIASLSNMREVFLSSPLQPGHIDLHPHNVLVDGSHVTLVDMDSIKQTHRESALGFAIVKLGRQVTANRLSNGEKYSHPSQVGWVLHQQLFVRDAPITRTRMFAEAEVLRRIGIILKLSMEENNQTWSHMGLIQFRLLLEINQLL